MVGGRGYAVDRARPSGRELVAQLRLRPRSQTELGGLAYGWQCSEERTAGKCKLQINSACVAGVHTPAKPVCGRHVAGTVML